MRAPPPVSELLKRTASLPDDAVVDDRIAAILLNMSAWTLKKRAPVPRIQTSARRFGRRMGDIRRLVRDGASAGGGRAS
jgi:hypothetical protein